MFSLNFSELKAEWDLIFNSTSLFESNLYCFVTRSFGQFPQ